MSRKKTGSDRIWTFAREGGDGEFLYPNADKLWRVYFPLFNFAGMKSAVTANFKGDVKTEQNSFLTVPVSIEDLHSCHWSRNFWVAPKESEPWSATGVGATYLDEGDVACDARGGLGWISVTRLNRRLRLESEVTLFVPSDDVAAEVMIVRVTNRGKKPARIVPTYAVCAYCRSADNLRSHRHVTSLLNRARGVSHGFHFKPSMNFDERGHRVNETSYFVLGFESNGKAPAGGWADLAEFCGGRFGLDRPDAVFRGLKPRAFAERFQDGREATGALRFAARTLAPGKSVSWTVVLGIAREDSPKKFLAYGAPSAAEDALERTKKFWLEKTSLLEVHTGQSDFDQWLRWLSFQPLARKVFGCSFMPDHDYGRGGRGWRDLWQDMLGLLLTDAASARQELVGFFAGIRWDGSNATIIGEGPGEFIADRDAISRVWMDHGIWPWLTVKLYIDQTGDTGILLEKERYWKDPQVRRSRARDDAWRPEQGTWQLDRAGKVVTGTLLEHILLEHYAAFYHVGEHDIMLLEGADWNDGIDMARTRGESVHFTAMYAANMKTLADVLEHMREKGALQKLDVPAELANLMRLGDRNLLSGWREKRAHFEAFLDAVTPRLSGERAELDVEKVVADLRLKVESIFERIRTQEWLTTARGESYFNAYYNELGSRVDGDTADRGTQMNLAAQAMTLLAGLPEENQIGPMIRAVRKNLGGHATGLPRLCTDTRGVYMELGRNFGYGYGNKENGAPFSHMNVMYAAGLFNCGRAREGWEVLKNLYESSVESARSRMLPGIPEYFEPDGRGAYCYLTGSAAWYILTVVTRLAGVRGIMGDLCIAPRIAAAGLSPDGWNLEILFAGRRLKIVFEGEGDSVAEITVNGEKLETQGLPDGAGAIIKRGMLDELPSRQTAKLKVRLKSF